MEIEATGTDITNMHGQGIKVVREEKTKQVKGEK